MDDAVYYRDLIGRVARSPGVEVVALSKSMPVNGASAPAMQPVSHSLTLGADAEAALEVASPSFFDALGATLEAGRGFTFADAMGSEPVAIITKALAEAMFPDHQAVGQYIRYGGEDRHQRLRVVGVVRDLAFIRFDVRAPRIVFVAWFQQPPPYARWPVVVVRYRNDAARATQAVGTAVAGLGREYVEASRTMAEQIDLSLTRERFLALTAGLFGTLAAGLLLVGISASLWQDLERSRRERAVRVALGAKPSMLLRSTVGASGSSVVIGSVIGAPLALGALSVLRRYTGIGSGDWVAVVLAIVALYVLYGLTVMAPALRAVTTPPSAVLRED